MRPWYVAVLCIVAIAIPVTIAATRSSGHGAWALLAVGGPVLGLAAALALLIRAAAKKDPV
jgi:hypothetical protein